MWVRLSARRTFHLEEVERLDGAQHGVVVEAELEVGRDSRLQLHLLVEALLGRPDAPDQGTRHLTHIKDAACSSFENKKQCQPNLPLQAVFACFGLCPHATSRDRLQTPRVVLRGGIHLFCWELDQAARTGSGGLRARRKEELLLMLSGASDASSISRVQGSLI